MQKLLLALITIIPSISFSQSYTPQQLRDDLKYLQQELPKRHTNLFAHITADAFNVKVEEISAGADTLNLQTFEAALFRLVRAIGDEHTRVEPEYNAVFPLQFDFFKEGIYVTATDSAHSSLLYRRLDGIGNVPVAQVLNRFKELVKTDNASYYQVFVLKFLNNPDFLKGLGLSADTLAAQYILDGKPVLIKSQPLQAGKPAINYTSRYLQGNTLYVDYSRCADMDDYPFTTFNDSLFATVARLKPRRLVLDLRHNSGGNSGILQPFLDSLKQSYLNHTGSLYVLIGKETFSSALMNAVDLKRNYNVILVGEPTSGSINHYGETRGFRLPHTQIIIGYSTRYWETWKGHDGPLTPDVSIQYSVTGAKAGKDKALEWVAAQ